MDYSDSTDALKISSKGQAGPKELSVPGHVLRYCHEAKSRFEKNE